MLVLEIILLLHTFYEATKESKSEVFGYSIVGTHVYNTLFTKNNVRDFHYPYLSENSFVIHFNEVITPHE